MNSKTNDFKNGKGFSQMESKEVIALRTINDIAYNLSALLGKCKDMRIIEDKKFRIMVSKTDEALVKLQDYFYEKMQKKDYNNNKISIKTRNTMIFTEKDYDSIKSAIMIIIKYEIDHAQLTTEDNYIEKSNISLIRNLLQLFEKIN